VDEQTAFSPYAAANLVTEWLRDTEFAGQRISPQMMYQYVNVERISAYRDPGGHWKINEEDLRKWFEGYVGRKRNLVAKSENAAENKASLRKTA
jgi:predicted site-specific integrase-resolvase